MDKEVVHIYAMEYYTAKEKNEIKPFVAAWMDPEIIILNEVNQTKKDKYHHVTFTWNLKNDTNEFTYKAERD